MGFECERHAGHHVNVDTCPVRIVDRGGRAHGESGEVVISNLAQPRHRAAQLPPGRHRAGVAPVRMRAQPPDDLAARGQDGGVAHRPADGEAIHPQAVKMLLRLEDSIRRYQVVQERPDRFLVSLVDGRGADRDGPGREARAATSPSQFGAVTATRCDFVDDLPRTAGGKVRPVVAWSP